MLTVTKTILLLGFTCLSFTSCRLLPGARMDTVKKNSKMTPLALLKQLGEGTHKIEKLHDKNEAELISLLGDFNSKQMVNPSKGLLEYQIELHNKFKRQDIEIKELWWVESSAGIEATLIVWLVSAGEQFQTHDTLLFNSKEIEF